MKYQQLHHQAKHIDNLIDTRIEHKTTHEFISHDELKTLVLAVYPDFYVIDSGWHKLVFGVRALDRNIVFKVGSKKSVHNDHRAYKRLPESLRHQVFARIYWHTKYCLLQQYGSHIEVSQTELDKFRRLLWNYGIIDIKSTNFRMVQGQLKLVDANITRFPAPEVWERLSGLWHRMPKKIVLLAKKLSNR